MKHVRSLKGKGGTSPTCGTTPTTIQPTAVQAQSDSILNAIWLLVVHR